MSGTLNNTQDNGTPTPFTSSADEEKSSRQDDIGVSSKAGGDNQKPAQPGATGFADDIRSLKMKILELERQAKDSLAGPENEEPDSKLTADLEQYRRMEACLYKHRKEWEETIGPGKWGRGFADARFVKFGQQEWFLDFKRCGTEHQYQRPDPFDPSHNCGAGQAGVKDDYDFEIDFGGRRDRIRKYYEWELERLFLAEEADKRRREQLKKAEQKKWRDRRTAEAKEQLEGAEGVDPGARAGAERAASSFSALGKPKLNWLDWYSFQRLAHQEERSAFIIDILIGDPIVDDELAVNQFWFGSSGRRAHKLHQDCKSDDSLIPGKDPLPERIRINSDPILRILAIILGSDGSSLSEVDEAKAIMLRPFKALVYSEQALRDWYAALEKKFKATSNTEGIFPEEPKKEVDTGTIAEKTSTDQPGLAEGHENRDDTASQIEEEDEGGEKEEDNVNDVTKSLVALEHLRCLLHFMDSTISAKEAHLNHPQCRKVCFSDLWQLFRPGVEVIDSDGKQAYRVIGVTNAKHRVAPAWERWYNPTADRGTSRGQKPPFSVNCVYIDFDGKHVGPVVKVFDFQRFDGEREVITLEIYPLRFHPVKQFEFSEVEWKELEAFPTIEKYRQKLSRRGAKFLEVAAVKHMYYAGPTLEVRDEVESPVVIDFEMTFTMKDEQMKDKPMKDKQGRERPDEEQTKRSWKPELVTLIGNPVPEEIGEEGACRGDCCRNQFVHDDAYVDRKHRAEYINSLLPKAGAVDEQPSVAIIPRPLKELSTGDRGILESDLVIMSYRVFGFVLRSRKWAKLDLSYLTNVHTVETPAATSPMPRDKDSQGNKETVTAFDRLVLEKGHQSMIVSLIAQHFRDKRSATGHIEETDIVKGKGNGLILLLHGAPGVGKTSTAEVVAEQFKKPLFQLTCGDLGTTAPEVERALEMNFSLANRWDCILLLDEADVFLAERTKEDFKRNGLVAVFLRLMEYYAGILFLTTNRVGDFDEAFTSRIHVSLYYPELNSLKTVKVFKINLDMIENRFKKKNRVIEVDRMGIGSFAAKHFADHPHARWNGRQIRNACQTALALAEFDAQRKSLRDVENPDFVVTLDVEHFMIVRDAYLEFTKYMHDLYGSSSSRRAKEAKLRAIWIDENNNIVGGMGMDKKMAFLASTQGQPVANYQQQPSTQQGAQQSYPQYGGFQQPGLQQQQQYYQQNQNFGPTQPCYTPDPAPIGVHVQQFSSGSNWNQGGTGVDHIRPQEPSGEQNHVLAAQQATQVAQPQMQQQQSNPPWLNKRIETLYASGQQGAGQLPPAGEAGYTPGPRPSSWQ
ncbi:hypothetical protein L207DRAFT_427831 [Hyaloscypha variabilis F]|uniref:AAA+ ATPase domain-containing protein n=1 Tax=Hyaloscypha variabilis (strain UAMH 11265 / GT02V1 / F) TaxID=1149755 RepID=A0A2J6RR20_HYAVF|nr:hypothetical protein L207DRAFT_427831 [Hyaloscypha variabilis F]